MTILVHADSLATLRVLPELIAHRGMPRLARENTLASFALALQAGADGIELDVHVAADGVVVVHHDPELAVPGKPRIVDLSVKELHLLGVPTLDAVCDLVGTKATLYVEAKAPHSAAPIVECLTAHDVRAAVHSFDYGVIDAVRALQPSIPVGLLVGDTVDDLLALTLRHAARDLWPAYSTIDPPLVTGVQAAGARVIAWTVNGVNDARRLLGMGVDGICTDDVRMLREALIA